MGIRLSSNNHSDSKLSWKEEYPMNYLFSFSEDRAISIQENREQKPGSEPERGITKEEPKRK